MLELFKPLLDIQELDMKMLRLMRVKRERQKELKQIEELRKDLHSQLNDKRKEIEAFDKQIAAQEAAADAISKKLKDLEGRQVEIKKVEEFNALTQEMTSAERLRVSINQKISELIDQKTMQEELFNKIEESMNASEESSLALEKEILSGVKLINEEGQQLKVSRDALAQSVSSDALKIYERLLRNKKDRVIVPIENRTCGGCHISLTAQHENLVRKGENLTFCEHCSRIHYWQEAQREEGEGAAPKRRRRRVAT